MKKIFIEVFLIVLSFNLFSQEIFYYKLLNDTVETTKENAKYFKKIDKLGDTIEISKYTIDSILLSRAHYSSINPDILDGLYESFDYRGKLISSGNYINNLKSDVWTIYNELHGYILEKTTYKENLKEGKSYIFYPNKKLKALHYYVRDTLILSKCYDTKGKEKDCSEIMNEIIVQTIPQFPGGDVSLFKFINDKLNASSKTNNNLKVNGVVVLVFTIEKDGSAVNYSVLKNSTGVKDCEIEALKIVSLMPRWTPSFQNDKAVSVKYNMPIFFRFK
jgi:hypothetical protein